MPVRSMNLLATVIVHGVLGAVGIACVVVLVAGLREVLTTGGGL